METTANGQKMAFSMKVSWSWSHSPKLTAINPGAMFNIRLCLWSARCIEVIIWFIAVHRGEIGAQIERYCSFHLVLLQTPWAVVGCPTLFSICILSVMGYNVDYDDTVLYVVQKTNIFLICVLAHCLCVSVQKDHTWDSKKYNKLRIFLKSWLSLTLTVTLIETCKTK